MDFASEEDLVAFGDHHADGISLSGLDTQVFSLRSCRQSLKVIRKRIRENG